MRKPATSSFWGVRRIQGRFLSVFKSDGLEHSCCAFDDEEDAALASDRLGRSLGIPEHKLNFPNRTCGASCGPPSRARPSRVLAANADDWEAALKLSNACAKAFSGDRTKHSKFVRTLRRYKLGVCALPALARDQPRPETRPVSTPSRRLR